MPSVESQMLTHAIRSAADSRSSSYRPPRSSGGFGYGGLSVSIQTDNPEAVRVIEGDLTESVKEEIPYNYNYKIF